MPETPLGQTLEKAKRIRDMAEIKLRPAFDAECAITPENFSHLIHNYDFDHKEPCQVTRDLGRCGHMHGDGWLGARKDGKEGLIGGDCAKKYFKGHEAFHSERRRIESQFKLDDQIIRYRKYLEDASFRCRFNELKRRSRAFDLHRSKINEVLCPRMVNQLGSIARTRSYAVTVSVKSIEKNDDDNELVRWSRHWLGDLAGGDLFEYVVSKELKNRRESAAAALQELQDYPEPRTQKLKATLKSLDGFEGCDGLMEKLESSLSRFDDPHNLNLLSFITDHRDDRLRVAALILKKTGKTVNDGNCRRLLEDLDQNVRDTVAPLGFRIP